MSFFLNADETLTAANQETSWSTGDKTNLSENLKVAYNYMVKAELSSSERQNILNKYGEIIDTARELGHIDIVNPFIEDPYESEMGASLIDGDGPVPEEDRISAFHQKLEGLMQSDLNLAIALKDKGIDSIQNIEKQIKIDIQDAYNKFIDVKSRSTGYGTFGSFLGMGGAIFRDPIIATTLPISAMYSIPRNFLAAAGKIALMEAIIAGTAETAVQYGAGVNEYRQEMGLDGDGAKRIGYATLAGALGGPALFGFFKGIGKTIDVSKQGLGVIRTKLEDLPIQKLKAMYKEMAKKNPNLAKKDLDNFNPEQFAEETPFVKSVASDKEHVVRSNEVADYVNGTGKIETVNELPASPVRPKELSEYDGQITTYDPDDIIFEPQIFQYKTDGDVLGVSKKLADVTEWDQMSAGTVLVYEFAPITKFDVGTEIVIDNKGTRAVIEKKFGIGGEKAALDDLDSLIKLRVKTNDGKVGNINLKKAKEFNKGRKAIVDGHQRLGLAKRLKAQGQKPLLPAYTFREADGFLPEAAMVKGMLINLRNNTGSAVDAARVLRSKYNIDWNKVKASLPPRSRIVKNADGLTKLSDDAWGLFLNKNVNEDLASLVGNILDNKSLHNKVLATLMKRKFASLQEMDFVINSIKNSDTVKSQQETLFGTDFLEESLFFEKAQLISYVTSNKKRLKQAFETIVKSDKDLSAAGNILKKEQNIEQGIENAKILEKLNIIGSRVGELSDDLNRAAKILKEGNTTEAREAAQQAIQRAVERGDFDGNFVSGPIRDDAVEVPTRTISKIEEPEVLEEVVQEAKLFDDVHNNTTGIEKQADDFNNQFFGPDREPTQVRPITRDEQLLVDQIKVAEPTDANVIKYETSDLYLKKIEEANKVKFMTNERPGYVHDATADFWKTRDFGKNFGVGLENFIKKFYGTGSRLKEKKLLIIMGPTGAGKSTLEKQYKNLGAYLADSDEVKKALPEYEGGLNANGVHVESSFINAVIMRKAVENGDNIIYPTTGREGDKLQKTIKAFEDEGYNIQVANVEIEPNIAKLRNIARTFTQNRVISNNLLDESTVKNIKNNYIKIKDEYKVKNTTVKEASAGDATSIQESGRGISPRVFEEELEEIITRLDPETKIPGNRVINQETGETQVEELTIKNILDDEAQDAALIERLKDCV